MPHFSLKTKVHLDTAIKFIDYINSRLETPRIDLAEVMLKMVHLTLLKFPEFRIFCINGQFLKAKELALEYRNTTHPEKNLVFFASSPQSLFQYQASNRTPDFGPTIIVTDATETDIVSFQPVLSYNNVL